MHSLEQRREQLAFSAREAVQRFNFELITQLEHLLELCLASTRQAKHARSPIFGMNHAFDISLLHEFVEQRHQIGSIDAYRLTERDLIDPGIDG